MERSKNDIWVGFFVLLGVLAAVFLSLKAANLLQFNLNPVYTLSASFDNIGGLKNNAAVKSAGVVVGRVAAIRFDDKSFQAQVDMDMQSDYRFPKDSSLKILTSGLLGEQYIGVTAGYEEAFLKAGDQINNTQSAVVLENLISQFLYNKAAETDKDDDKDAAESKAP